MENPIEPLEGDNTPILKEKKKRNISDEQRAKASENMRKVSLERIEKARIASEERLALEAKHIKAKMETKLEKVEQKVKKIKEIKEEKQLKEEKPLAELKKQKGKRIIMQESSDSEDYYDDNDDSESDTEIIYVAKKPKAKQQKETILKAKPKAKQEKPNQEVPKQEIPKTIIKFL